MAPSTRSALSLLVLSLVAAPLGASLAEAQAAPAAPTAEQTAYESAGASPDATTTSAPPSGEPVAAEPAAAPREPRPGPRGPWVALGAATLAPHHGGALRIEGGIPVGPKQNFALHLPVFLRPMRGYTVDFDTGALERHPALFAVIVPGLQYEYRLLEGYGDLSVVGQFGLGASVYTARVPDVAFMPGGRESTWSGVARLAASGRFVFPFGLQLELQPLGMMVYANKHGASAAYEFSFLVGYRFE